MGTSKSVYQFGEFRVTSLKAVRELFAKIRNETGIGNTVTDLAFQLAVAELLRGHAEHAEKVGCGVLRFFVERAPQHTNTSCFWIERNDGTKSDFGVEACIRSVGALNRLSLRALVRPQIEAFREARLRASDGFFVSEYSARRFPDEEVHVDHEIPFLEIARKFGEKEGIDLETDLITIPVDAKSEPTFRDEALALRFLEFHGQFPLRLVSKRENLSEIRSGKSSVTGC